MNRDLNRLNDDQIRVIYEKMKVIITDSHFVYSKPEGCGNHGTSYINKDGIFPNQDTLRHLAFEMSHRVFETLDPVRVQVVVGPESGGSKFSMWLAFELNERMTENHFGRSVKFVSADKKEGGGFEIRRGYDQLVREKVAIIGEDILNTGGSGAETVEAVQKVGGIPIALAAMANRGGVTYRDLGVRHLFSLMDVKFESMTEKECAKRGPCSKGIPVRIDLGHGKNFLARQSVTN